MNESNKLWEVRDGSITFLKPPTNPNRPNIRKPYQWEMSHGNCDALLSSTRYILSKVQDSLQCCALWITSLKYGVRYDLFLLGYRPGLCSGPGITENQWNSTIDNLTRTLTTFLPGASLYADSWSRDRKFQARFNTYIMTK